VPADTAPTPSSIGPGGSIEVEPLTPIRPDWQRRTVLRQQWTELAYFHWAYEPSVVQRRLPRGVTVDTFDGSAWVGLIPFEMRDVRIGPTPPVPWLGSFIEINVRTYVVDELGRRAVWFFSLDVPRSVIVAVARTAFALPYCWAEAGHERHGDRHRYWLNRRWPRGTRPHAEMRFTVGPTLADDEIGDLGHFLTARWALLTTRRRRVLYGAVRHPQWPLHRVVDLDIDQDVVEAAGLPSPEGAPHAMYSPGVPVEIAWLQRLAAEPGT
jgi:uncharacterized protein YqjF (DUF2071 family)